MELFVSAEKFYCFALGFASAQVQKPFIMGTWLKRVSDAVSRQILALFTFWCLSYLKTEWFYTILISGSSSIKKLEYQFVGIKKAVLLLIILLALFLRLYNLANNPVALNQDEAVNGYDAYALGLTLRDHHGNFLPILLESFGDWVSPVLTYLTIPFIKIFGLTEFAIRLPVALLGVATVILFYIFTVQIFNSRNWGLLAAFLLAIAPWHITLSRWAIPPSIVPFFLLVFLLLFWKIYQSANRNIFLFFLSAVCAAILTYSYPTQKLFVPLLLVALSLLCLRAKLEKLVLSWTVYLLLVAPLYLISFLEPGKYNARFNEVSVFNSNSNLIASFIRSLTIYITYLLPDFHFGLGDSDIMHHVPGFGSNYAYLSIFFYIGVLSSFWIIFKPVGLNQLNYAPDMNIHKFLLLWLFISPIPASLTVPNNHILRMVHALPVVVIFIVLGLRAVYHALMQIRIKKSLISLVVFIGLINIASFCEFYFFPSPSNYPEQSKEVYQYGIKAAMTYAIQNESRFSKISNDTQIKQPDIYYLFYSNYNPQQINFAQIKPGSAIKNIGKYEFRSLDSRDIVSSQEVHKVEDASRVWYRLYAGLDQSLVIQKAIPPR